MAIVDFHNHYYPPTYIDAVQSGVSSLKHTTDDEGNPVLYYPGDYNVVVPGHRDIEFREAVLIEQGIDKQVLTFTSPGTHVETPKVAAKFASLVNDALAEIKATRSRFTALATLPLNDPDASVKELERAMTTLGFKGVMLFSNVNGVALADERYWPLYEKANELGAVCYIHPIHPVGVESMTEYWLMPLVGFVHDTTLAAAKLVFTGVAERFPRIRWVLAHLGGTIPYLAERLDRGFRAFKDCRQHISEPPSTYLKRFYYDTVNFDQRALELAIQFAGVDQVLAGSDYPHMIGSLDQMQGSIAALTISEKDKAAIRWDNTAKLLGF